MTTPPPAGKRPSRPPRTCGATYIMKEGEVFGCIEDAGHSGSHHTGLHNELIWTDFWVTEAKGSWSPGGEA